MHNGWMKMQKETNWNIDCPLFKAYKPLVIKVKNKRLNEKSNISFLFITLLYFLSIWPEIRAKK